MHRAADYGSWFSPVLLALWSVLKVGSRSHHQCWESYFKSNALQYAYTLQKVTNYVTFMESNVLRYFFVTFALLFKYEQGLIVVF